ncbi:MAG: head-tail connector protein [Desulfovibrionaceae bacterium]
MEPITLEQAKLYCRIDNDVEDSLVAALIVAAREAAEARCGRGMSVEDWPEGYPEQARVWQFIQISTMYENRESYADAKVYRLDHVAHLLDPFVVPALA